MAVRVVREHVAGVLLTFGQLLADRAEARHDAVRLGGAALRQQELGRFRDQPAHADQDQPGRQIQQPQDAPREVGDQQGRKAGGGEIAADRAEAADQHQRPAAMLGRHGLGQQRIGDRQHAARARAHQKAHGDVPVQRRHGAADRGADEHHGGQKDRRLAPVDVGDDPPQDRAADRADQREERHQRGVGVAHAVLRDHAGHDEAERGGLHHVDDERDDQHGHQHPVGAAERRVLGRMDRYALRRLDMVRDVAREQAVGGDADARHDQEHAEDHPRVHRHSGQMKAHAAAHQEHRQVQQHADGDACAAQPERPHALAFEKNPRVHISPSANAFCEHKAEFFRN